MFSDSVSRHALRYAVDGLAVKATIKRLADLDCQGDKSDACSMGPASLPKACPGGGGALRAKISPIIWRDWRASLSLLDFIFDCFDWTLA